MLGYDDFGGYDWGELMDALQEQRALRDEDSEGMEVEDGAHDW